MARKKIIKLLSGKEIGNVFRDSWTCWLRRSEHAVFGDSRLTNLKGEQDQAWSIQEHILDQLKEHRIRQVRVVDRDSGDVYSAPVAAFEDAVVIRHGVYGRQRALPFDRWDIRRPEEARL